MRINNLVGALALAAAAAYAGPKDDIMLCRYLTPPPYRMEEDSQASIRFIRIRKEDRTLYLCGNDSLERVIVVDGEIGQSDLWDLLQNSEWDIMKRTIFDKSREPAKVYAFHKGGGVICFDLWENDLNQPKERHTEKLRRLYNTLNQPEEGHMEKLRRQYQKNKKKLAV
ncbi:hypothetical protein KY345_00405 [Candidatus Woesearchaeota archaeon]|nr:hypothetical protein [Candidatus Woesearchaeota archaeon]